MTAAQTFIDKIIAVVVNPLILLLVALALVVFLWGIVEFIAHADGTEGRTKGKSHMLWGIIGLFIMIAVLGILRAVVGTIGACGTLPPGVTNVVC